MSTKKIDRTMARESSVNRVPLHAVKAAAEFHKTTILPELYSKTVKLLEKGKRRKP